MKPHNTKSARRIKAHHAQRTVPIIEYPAKRTHMAVPINVAAATIGLLGLAAAVATAVAILGTPFGAN